jgi:tetratricopeptide (TPR) repeat protein
LDQEEEMEAIIRNAEETYQQGMGELRYGRPRKALGMFRRAIAISSEATEPTKRRARYLSYCGICLYHTKGPVSEAYGLCRRAVGIDGTNPGLWRNLALIANAAGRPGQAHRALSFALRMNPTHRGVLRDLRKLGVRSSPVIGFLARASPVNVVLGRLRSAVSAPEA